MRRAVGALACCVLLLAAVALPACSDPGQPSTPRLGQPLALEFGVARDAGLEVRITPQGGVRASAEGLSAEAVSFGRLTASSNPGVAFDLAGAVSTAQAGRWLHIAGLLPQDGGNTFVTLDLGPSLTVRSAAPFEQPLDGVAMATHEGRLYRLAGNSPPDGGAQRNVRHAVLLDDGTLGPGPDGGLWISTGGLPHNAAVVRTTSLGGALWALGRSEDGGSALLRAVPNPSGSIPALGGWQTATGNLDRVGAALAGAHGHLWLVGGRSDVAGGFSQTGVRQWDLLPDGGLLEQNGPTLPFASGAPVATFSRGFLWLAGAEFPTRSWDGGTYASATAGLMAAPLRPDGTLGNWLSIATDIPLTGDPLALAVTSEGLALLSRTPANRASATRLQLVGDADESPRVVLNGTHAQAAGTGDALQPELAGVAWTASPALGGELLMAVGGHATDSAMGSAVLTAPPACVRFASLFNDGGLGSWSSNPPLQGAARPLCLTDAGPRNSASLIDWGGGFAVVGTEFLETTDAGPIYGADGRSWLFTNSLQDPPTPGPSQAEGQAHAGAAYAGGRIFLVGGRVGFASNIPGSGTELDRVQSFDPRNPATAWRQEPTLQDGRWLHAVASDGSHIWALGGEDAVRTRLASVERLDVGPNGVPTSNWQSDTPLPQGRAWTSAVVHQGFLHVWGGETDLPDLSSLHLVARIGADGSLGPWGSTPPTGLDNSRVRAGATMVSLPGGIGLLGGREGSGFARPDWLTQSDPWPLTRHAASVVLPLDPAVPIGSLRFHVPDGRGTARVALSVDLGNGGAFAPLVTQSALASDELLDFSLGSAMPRAMRVDLTWQDGVPGRIESISLGPVLSSSTSTSSATSSTSSSSSSSGSSSASSSTGSTGTSSTSMSTGSSASSSASSSTGSSSMSAASTSTSSGSTGSTSSGASSTSSSTGSSSGSSSSSSSSSAGSGSASSGSSSSATSSSTASTSASGSSASSGSTGGEETGRSLYGCSQSPGSGLFAWLGGLTLLLRSRRGRRAVLLAGLVVLGGEAGAQTQRASKVKRHKVVVADLQAQSGVAPETAALVTDQLVSQLGKVTELQVISSRDVTALLGLERQRQLLGCTESGCLAELAGALGADDVVSGSVGRLGRSLLLTVTRVETRSATAKSRWSERLRESDDPRASEEALLDRLPSAIAVLYPEYAGTSAAPSPTEEEPTFSRFTGALRGQIVAATERGPADRLGLGLQAFVGYRPFESMRAEVGLTVAGGPHYGGSIRVTWLPLSFGPGMRLSLGGEALLLVGSGELPAVGGALEPGLEWWPVEPFGLAFELPVAAFAISPRGYDRLYVTPTLGVRAAW